MHLKQTFDSLDSPQNHSAKSPNVTIGSFFLLNFIYLFLFVLGLRYHRQASSGCGEWGLLPSCSAQACHCSGYSCGAQVLSTPDSEVVTPQLLSTGSVVVVHGLGCSTARGIFPDQGSNLCLLHLAGRFFTTEPQADFKRSPPPPLY